MTDAKRPRLRFAPSPTGYLHIGGVRTALFNWLWARKTGGSFILRIEDTDRERSTLEAEQIVLRDMRWLGMDWDEGPEVGGEHGPYRQMERLPTYTEYADKLVDAGKAYRCYATKAELDEARAALKDKDPKAKFRYPGWWRERTDWPDGQPYVYRLKVPTEGVTAYTDLVFGEQSIRNDTMQDVVLMRSDGVPLYNLGCVVDDMTMGITLVGRGRDHMINTPIQVLIYQALGAEVPEFAHLPLMLGKGGAKLSKRHGAVSVGEYRDQGVTPAGLLNYLARFGWSHGDEEVFSMDDLIEKFDWSGCNRSDGRFDANKLTAIAFEHLKRDELVSDDDYLALLAPWLAEKYGEVDQAKVRAVLGAIRPRSKTLLEAAQSLDWLLAKELSYDDKAKKKFLLSERAAPLAPLRALLADIDGFTAEPLEQAVKSWAEAQELKLGAVAQPARVALTGRTFSPGLFDVMELLGKDETLARLDKAAALSGEQSAQA
jgi:glutamyl-tRNA synthetase